MSTPPSSSGNRDPVRYRQTLDIVIGNISEAKKQLDLELQTSAFNEELKCYGEEMRTSRWVLNVARQDGELLTGKQVKYVAAYLALEGNGDIELMAEETQVSIIGLKGESLFSFNMRQTSFKAVDVKERPLSPEDFKGTGAFYLDDLTEDSPCTDGDLLRFRAEIIFTVISGGTPPATIVPAILPSFIPVPEPDSAGPDPDEYILNSSDGRRFRVKKQLISEIPYFNGIVKAIEDPKAGFTLSYDGETLENVFDFLKAKRAKSLELNGKILKAADTFGSKELQMEAMKPLVTDLSIEKAEDVFRFAAENNIACLRARIVSLIPSLIEKVSGANAAKALILSAKMDHPALRKKALDVIPGDLTEFYLANGFDEIGSVPGLAAEVREAVAKYRNAKRSDDGQNGAPAKKAKTT